MYKFTSTVFYVVFIMQNSAIISASSTEEDDYCKPASYQERCEKGKEYWTYNCTEDECKNVTLNACGKERLSVRFLSQEECEEKCLAKSNLCISSSSAEKEKRWQAETRQPHHQHQHNHHQNHHHKKKQTSGSPKGKSKHQSSYKNKKKRKENKKLALKFGRRRPLKFSGRMAKQKS